MARHRKMMAESATMMPTLVSVSPIEQIALMKQHSRMSAGDLPPAPPVNVKPIEFEFVQDRGPLPFQPIAPAADGSKTLRIAARTEVEGQPGTDSPAQSDEAVKLPDDFMDLLSAG